MGRRLTTVLGAAAAVAGFAAALASLALPWARYRLSVEGEGGEHAGDLAVHQLDLGTWYVLALLAMLGLLAACAMGAGQAARAAGSAAVLLALGGSYLVFFLLGDTDAAGWSSTLTTFGGVVAVDVWPGPAAAIGKATFPLLGAAAALLSVRTPRSAPAPAAGASGPVAGDAAGQGTGPAPGTAAEQR